MERRGEEKGSHIIPSVFFTTILTQACFHRWHDLRSLLKLCIYYIFSYIDQMMQFSDHGSNNFLKVNFFQTYRIRHSNHKSQEGSWCLIILTTELVVFAWEHISINVFVLTFNSKHLTQTPLIVFCQHFQMSSNAIQINSI